MPSDFMKTGKNIYNKYLVGQVKFNDLSEKEKEDLITYTVSTGAVDPKKLKPDVVQKYLTVTPSVVTNPNALNLDMNRLGGDINLSSPVSSPKKSAYENYRQESMNAVEEDSNPIMKALGHLLGGSSEKRMATKYGSPMPNTKTSAPTTANIDPLDFSKLADNGQNRMMTKYGINESNMDFETGTPIDTQVRTVNEATTDLMNKYAPKNFYDEKGNVNVEALKANADQLRVNSDERGQSNNRRGWNPNAPYENAVAEGDRIREQSGREKLGLGKASLDALKVGFADTASGGLQVVKLAFGEDANTGIEQNAIVNKINEIQQNLDKYADTIEGEVAIEELSHIDPRRIAYTGLSAMPQIVSAVVLGKFAKGGAMALANRSFIPQAVKTGVNFLASKSVFTSAGFGTIAGGSYARQAELEGRTYDEQVAYGALGGTIELVTEAVPLHYFGKMFGDAGTALLKGNIGKNLRRLGGARMASKYGKQLLTGMTLEAGQEAIVNPLDNLARMHVFDEDYSAIAQYDKQGNMVQQGIIDYPALAENAYAGGAMGIIMGGIGLPFQYASHRKANKMLEDAMKGKEIQPERIRELAEDIDYDLKRMTENDKKALNDEYTKIFMKWNYGTEMPHTSLKLVDMMAELDANPELAEDEKFMNEVNYYQDKLGTSLENNEATNEKMEQQSKNVLQLIPLKIDRVKAERVKKLEAERLRQEEIAKSKERQQQLDQKSQELQGVTQQREADLQQAEAQRLQSMETENKYAPTKSIEAEEAQKRYDEAMSLAYEKFGTYALNDEQTNYINNELGINLESLLSDVKASMVIDKREASRPKGKYAPAKNTRLEQAQQAYDEAVKQIHDRFGTYELRDSEMASIKDEMGIDLDALVQEIEEAQNTDPASILIEAGKKRKLAKTAGVDTAPLPSLAPKSPKAVQVESKPEATTDIRTLTGVAKPTGRKLVEEAETTTDKTEAEKGAVTNPEKETSQEGSEEATTTETKTTYDLKGSTGIWTIEKEDKKNVKLVSNEGKQRTVAKSAFKKLATPTGEIQQEVKAEESQEKEKKSSGEKTERTTVNTQEKKDKASDSVQAEASPQEVVDKVYKDRKGENGRVVEAKTREEKRIAKMMKDNFGTDVVYYESNANDMEHGFYFGNMNSKTVFLRKKEGNTLNDLLFTLGHEWWHSVKVNDADLYSQIKSIIEPTITVDQIEQYREMLDPDYSDQLDMDGVIEEMLSDEAGNNFTDPEFFMKLYNESATLMDKVVDSIKAFFKKVNTWNRKQIDNALDQEQIDLFSKGFEDAVAKVKERIKLDKKGLVKNSDGSVVARPEYPAQMSFRTLQEDMQRRKDFLRDQMIENGTSKKQAEKRAEAYVSGISETFARMTNEAVAEWNNLVETGESLFPVNEGEEGAIRDNSDKLYIYSFDSNGMCVKRLEYAETFNEVFDTLEKEGMLNDPTVLADASTVLKLVMKQHGKEAPCLYCFAENPRVNFVREVWRFGQMIADKNAKLSGSEGTVENIKLARKAFPDFDMNVLDINYFLTDEGTAQIREDLSHKYHEYKFTNKDGKEVYLFDFVKGLAQASSNQNMPKVYSEYRTWFLEKANTPRKSLDGLTLIEYWNKNAGARMQSTSDFQIEHVVDYNEMLVDLQLLGSRGHAYTKVEDFMKLYKDTGLKIQGSLFAKENPLARVEVNKFQNAMVEKYTKAKKSKNPLKITDKNLDAFYELYDSNKLSNDEASKFENLVNRMIKEDTWMGMKWDTVFNYTKNSKDIGAVFIPTSHEQMRFGARHDKIPYLIPFHASGMAKEDYQNRGWKDYTYHQTEKWIDKDAHKGEKSKIYRSEVVDFEKGSTNEEIALNYLNKAKEKGVTPVFKPFADKIVDVEIKKGKYVKKKGVTPRALHMTLDGYGKFVKDFARTDTPFRPVQAHNFETGESYVDINHANKLLTDFAKQGGRKINADKKLAKETIKLLKGGLKGAEANKQDAEEKILSVKKSARDLTKTREFKEWFKDSKVVDENGEPLTVYHGSPVHNFTEFDKSKINPNDPDAPYNGFWFSSSFNEADTSGRFPWGRPNTDGQTRAFYLSIKNPITREEAYKIFRNLKEPTDKPFREVLQDRGYDGVIHEPHVIPSKAEFDKNGEVSLGKKNYILKKDEEWGGVDLYQSNEHITGYENWDDAISQLNKGTFVVFEPTQIKSVDNQGTFDSSNPDIRFSNRDLTERGLAPTFYSKLQKTIEEKMSNQAPVNQIISIIDKGGIKKEEVEWSGIKEWLAEQDGKVAKEAVMDYLKANQIEIKETTISDRMQYTEEQEEQLNALSSELSDRQTEAMDMYGKITGKDFPLEELAQDNIMQFNDVLLKVARGTEYENDAYSVTNEIMSIDADISGIVGNAKINSRKTKYHQYTLEGGENYKEVLFTLPVRVNNNNKYRTRLFEIISRAYPEILESDNTYDEIDQMISEVQADRSGDDINAWLDAFEEVRSEIEPILQAVRKENINTYKSSHWSEPNVLAHTRINDRIDSDGNRILFAEEVQSDMHQEGRKKGYQSKVAEKDIDLKWFDPNIPEGHDPSNYMGYWESYYKGTNNMITRHSGNLKEKQAMKEAVEWANIQEESKVPNAPFKTTWHEFVLKRLIRYGAENGYDKIAWTTGEQQAERYDLSKHVSEVSIMPWVGDTGMKLYEVYVYDINDSQIINNDGMTIEEIESNLGKEIAEKAEKMPTDKATNLTGLDLQVGGEGMKGFYNKMIPDYLKKYVKKWGSKVEVINLDTQGRYDNQVMIDRDEAILRLNRGETLWGHDDEIDHDYAITSLEDLDEGQHDYIFIYEGETTDYNQQLAITITPEMKNSVLYEGQPLFSRGTREERAESAQAIEATITPMYEEDKPSLKTKEGRKHIKMDTYMKLVDAKAPIRELIEVAEKLSGKKVVDDKNAYMLALNQEGSDMIASFVTTERMVDSEGNIIDKSFAKVLENIKKDELKQFDAYLKAVHALDLIYLDKQVFKEDIDIEKIQMAIQHYEENHENFKATAEELHRWWNKFVDTWLVKTGLLSQEAHQTMMEMYPHYVPNLRNMNKADLGYNAKAGFANQKNPIKKMKGSERPTYSAIEALVVNIDKYVKTVKRREVMLAIHDLYGEVEGLDMYLEKVESKKRNQEAEIEQAEDNYESLDEMVEVEAENLLVKKGETEVKVVDREGKTHIYKVYDPLFLRAISSLSPRQLPPYIEMLGRITRVTKVLITSLNPIFSLTSNAPRDFVQAMVMSKQNPITFAKEYWKAMGDVLKNSENFQSYHAMGGGHASRIASTRNLLDESISKIMPDAKDRTIGSTFMDFISFIEKTSDLVESAPRVAEYKSYGTETYRERVRALYEANDLTLNFKRRGEWSYTLDPVIMFFNAGMQDLDKLYRTGFKDKEKAKFRLTKALSTLTLGSFAVMAWNYAMMDDEDEYRNINSFYRDNYWLISMGNGNFFRIPKPRGLGVIFGAVPERIMRTAMGENAWDGFLNTLTTNFLPPTRTVVNPIVDLYANKSWSGSPIVSQSIQMKSKEGKWLEYDERTTELSKALAKRLKILGVSPKKLDYFMQQYSGILGQIAMPLMTQGSSLSDVLKRKVVVDTTYQNELTTKFYEYKNKLDDAEDIYKRTGKEGKYTDYGMYKYYNKISQYVRDSKKYMKDIEFDETLSKRERKLMLDAVQSDINDILTQAIKDIEKEILKK